MDLDSNGPWTVRKIHECLNFCDSIGDAKTFLAKNPLSGWKRALHQRKISRLISNKISLDVQSPISQHPFWYVTPPVFLAEVNLGINPETNFRSTIFPWSFIFPVYITDYTVIFLRGSRFLPFLSWRKNIYRYIDTDTLSPNVNPDKALVNLPSLWHG